MSKFETAKLVPKHKKRKIKKSPKKANHKHEYEDVVVRIHFRDSVLYYLGYRCTICGKISNDMRFWDDNNHIVNENLIKNKYNHLDIVDVKR